MSVVIKFQVSLFIASQPLTTAPENFKKAFELFFPHGYFPSTVQELAPGIPTTDRLTLQNNALGISVQFLSNRIDFVAMPFASAQNQLPLAQFCDEVRAITAIALDAFPVGVERIGLASERVLNDLDSKQLDQVRTHFIAPGIDEFDQTVNVEWMVRQVILAPLNPETDLLSNQIYSVNRGKMHLSDQTGVREFEALQVALDVNTNPTSRMSFDGSGVKQYLADALQAHDSLLQKIEKRIYDR